MRLAVFASGKGGNLRNIAEHIESGALTGVDIGLVISNNSRSGAAEFAAQNGLPFQHQSLLQFGNDAATFANAQRASLVDSGIDFIALAGYMKPIPDLVLSTFRNRILNIHPALLPSFGGAGMYGMKVHESVIARGCKVSGATVHFVTEEYDAGPILMQEACPVNESDTAESLAERVREIEHRIYPQAIQLIATSTVRIAGSRTFFHD